MTETFGLPESMVTDLVASVRGETSVDPADAFARMAWSAIAEPADQIAGQFIAALGAAPALERVLAGDVRAASEVWLTDGLDPARARRNAQQAFDRWQPRVAARPLVRAIEQAAARGITVVVPEDESWPSGLAVLGPAEPIALWVRGDRARLPALDRSAAVVGARASTGYGDHVATELSAGLAERGFAILSGGAYGIDAAAHRAALTVEGMTVAFLAGGLDRFYPAGNADLLARVAEAGLVLAEVPPGVSPTRFRFLSRNRLLAATGSATVVVEAGVRSGSLNTAHHALAVGRPLGVVPGAVTNAMSAGCHRLLRDEEATCVTSVDDVVELAGGRREDPELVYEPTDPAVVRVLDALGVRRGRSAEEVARSSGLAISDVQAVLGPLEVVDVVRRNESGWVRVPGSRPPARSGRQ